MLRKGLPSQGDANTIKNFATRARRGHHYCRNQGTSAHPIGSSTTIIHRLSCDVEGQFQHPNEARPRSEMAQSSARPMLSGLENFPTVIKSLRVDEIMASSVRSDVTNWQAEKDRRNEKALARLSKSLPAIFPPAVLARAHSRPFIPPTLRFAIDSYWRAHPIRADRLARALAARSGAPVPLAPVGSR